MRGGTWLRTVLPTLLSQQMSIALSRTRVLYRCMPCSPAHSPAQTSGDGLATAVQALQAAEADARRRMPGQGHYMALLQAVSAGLAEGAPAGLQKVGAASCSRWLEVLADKRRSQSH